MAILRVTTPRILLPYTSFQIVGNFAEGTVGTAYSSDLTIIGGAGGYTNPRVLTGTLPTGLSLSIVAGNLRLSGTPTIDFTEVSSVAVDDSLGVTTSSVQTVKIGMVISGLFLRYDMLEASGTTVVDSSGNGRDGTYSTQSGALPALGQTSILPSGKGKSVLFGASSAQDYVLVPSGFMSTNMKPPFTYISFLRTPATSSSGQLTSSGTGSTGFNFYLYNNVLVAGRAGVTNNAIDSRTLSNNTNYMVSLTVASNGDTYIYVNKVASAKFATAFSPSDTAVDPVWIGLYGQNQTINRLYGYLQKNIYCNVALTSAQINAIYDAS